MRRTSRHTLIVVSSLVALAISVADPAAAHRGGRVSVSKNWAGYVVPSTSVRSVGATWTVPTVLTPLHRRKDFYSVAWIGIGGTQGTNLIQVGTEHDWYRGAPYYRAFYEVAPAPATTIAAIGVRPGDQMVATVTRASGNRFTITITNATTRQSFTTTVTYTGRRTSAEWILERPSVNGRLAALTPTSPVHFNGATVNGVNAGLVQNQAVKMTKGRTALAIASKPDSDADGFLVVDGGVAPSPPPP